MTVDVTVIRQPAGQRTLALRESYLAICEGDKCEAHLLNANERWYGYKLAQRQQARHTNKVAVSGGEIPEADESLWVHMSADEWVGELLGIYDEKTLRKKLARLVERGFLATRTNPRRKWDRKPQWMFMRSAVQAAVDTWEAGRQPPELDPSPADEREDSAQEHPGEDAESTRANVRMESGKVPDGAGQSSASNRANARSNTTGVFSQGSSLRDPSQVVVHSNLEDNTRARASETAAPVAEPSPPPHTTTGDAAREEGTPVDIPSTAHPQPPVGGAADAANGEDTPTVTDEDLRSLGILDDQATSVQKVPGGGAAGP
ncbi:hypothetical protein V3W47_16655, partial [Deinococcus sp. YIM 134068]|uniref:hypothetical protein n=1 Tax=Deinococcus lichenicola TaxID=3118910 RepID=UPI002F9598B2